MKILMVTPYVPYPPSSGGQIRTLNLIKHLSKNNKITLVSLYKDDSEKKYLSHLKKYCQRIYLSKRVKKPWQIDIILKTIFSTKPFLVIRNYSKEAKKIIENLIYSENFDVIHAETFYIMPHIPETKIPIFLVEQTIEFKVYQHFVKTLSLPLKTILYFDIIKLKYWERYYWKKARIVATVSHSDMNVIKEIEPKIKTVIIPNGAGEEMIVKRLKKKELEKPIILFQGNFNWLQNIEAAAYLAYKIYPKLKNILPKASVIISGQNVTKINHLKKTGVKIINNEPDDIKKVKEIYDKASIFIAPIFGPGGTRLKILAAMAAGIPVISTPIGIEGLELESEKHALTAKTADEFVKKIFFLANSQKNYQEIRKNAYNLVKEKYSWKKIAQKLEMTYQKIKNQ